jgi:hypothetical protein
LQQLSSTRVILIRVVIGGLVLSAVYLIFEFGRIQAGYDIVGAATDRSELQEQIAALENDKLVLREQIAMLETHRGIDRESYAEVEQSLVALQAKIREQQDDIAFYRGIVSPTDGKAGLRVQNFKVTRGSVERKFTVRLVLVQAMKHDRKVSGSVRLTIAGSEDGLQKVYTFSDLMPADDDSQWSFSFRYFQDFERDIVLPDGFTPETVTVKVDSRTSSISSIETSFQWGASLG